jgi:hypothetical protein
MIKPSRNFSIDLIKAISIFGVVYIHASGLGICNSNFQEFFKATFRFCVPFFIVIWAFFFEKGISKRFENGEQNSFIKTKLYNLLKIFLFWSLLYFLIETNWTELTLKKIVVRHLIYGWMGQYFIIILLQLIVFYKFIRYSYDEIYIKYTILILVFSFYFIRMLFPSLLHPYFLNITYIPFFYWIPYVYLGIAASRNKLIKSNFFYYLFFLIPLEYLLLQYYHIDTLVYITLGVLFGALGLSLFAIQKKLIIENKYVTKFLSYVGSNTMTIFLVNPLVIILIKKVLYLFNIEFSCNHSFLLIFIPFLYTFIIIILCLSFVWIIKVFKLNGHIN